MRELLAGPNALDEIYGMHTAIPSGTTLRSVNIKDRVATVDLSSHYDDGGGTLSMRLRLAQVVFTLTQFPTVDAVVLRMDGAPVEVFGGEGLIIDHPMRRDDFESVTPAILVERPTPGDEVASPLRITGSANTFEATFIAEVHDAAGATLQRKTITATSGSGTRGTFDATLTFTAPREEMGALVVYESSARDGSPINVVSIPIKLMKR